MHMRHFMLHPSSDSGREMGEIRLGVIIKILVSSGDMCHHAGLLGLYKFTNKIWTLLYQTLVTTVNQSLVHK